MQCKAIIFDLDGTAVESKKDALPSKRLITAVKKAEEKILANNILIRFISVMKERSALPRILKLRILQKRLSISIMLKKMMSTPFLMNLVKSQELQHIQVIRLLQIQ